MATTIDPVVVVASAARTTNGNSGILQTGGKTVSINREHLNLLVDVTAASGTSPTLDVSVEYSMDGGVTFAVVDTTADAFAQITAATVVVKQFQLKSPHYRVVWGITGGTPSFTFSVREYLT